jgi:hypothetical protein
VRYLQLAHNEWHPQADLLAALHLDPPKKIVELTSLRDPGASARPADPRTTEPAKIY